MFGVKMNLMYILMLISVVIAVGYTKESDVIADQNQNSTTEKKVTMELETTINDSKLLHR